MRESAAGTIDGPQTRSRLLHLVEKFRPDLTSFVETYKAIHQNPELTGLEEQTARYAAEHLRSEGYDVISGIGGFSAVGVLRNGDGTTVLLRADTDALPIKEETGLAYASTRCMKNLEGKEEPVMHACGHDMHVAMLMAAASCLMAARDHWNGTLICLFQPAEEGGGGAESMIRDGLYGKVPRPDLLLAQHVTPLRSGTLALRAGPALTASDTYEIRVFGLGGHGSRPHKAIDPILLAAHTLVRLQSIISREVPPGDVAVLTCGSFHGGSKDNIIPDYADMTLNVRSYEPDVRTRVLDSIKRVIKAECECSGSPRDPLIREVESLPPVINDDKHTSQLRTAFEEAFGSDVQLMERGMASEDFPALSIGEIPYVYWNLGCTDHDVWEKAKSRNELDKIPSNHSSKFCPAVDPTLRRGVDALAVAALQFLDGPKNVDT